MKSLEILMSAVLAVLALAFCAGIFLNIAYPLMWADEAETAMFGERVMKYGYPKFHDGPNIVYPIRSNEPGLGVNAKDDAYIGSGWAQFYYATIGLSLAGEKDGIYEKTALMRVPFAIAGASGVLILIVTMTGLLGRDRRRKMAFAGPRAMPRPR